MPDAWQVAYILAPTFGWVRLDEDIGRWVRVINNLYVEVPRKNGKTTLPRERFDVREIAYDPWNSTQLVNNLLGDDAPMVKMRQGFVSMSPPTKELLRILREGKARSPKLRHFGNPLLRWQVDHLAVETDSAGNVKPSKKTSSDKIDGVVALIMGLDRTINRRRSLRLRTTRTG